MKPQYFQDKNSNEWNLLTLDFRVSKFLVFQNFVSEILIYFKIDLNIKNYLIDKFVDDWRIQKLKKA